MNSFNSIGSKSSGETINIIEELERVPDPARGPGPEEKLAINKTSTRYYLAPNLEKAREPFSGLDMAKRQHLFCEFFQGQCKAQPQNKGLPGPKD